MTMKRYFGSTFVLLVVLSTLAYLVTTAINCARAD
jgi:hypothetical protein